MEPPRLTASEGRLDPCQARQGPSNRREVSGRVEDAKPPRETSSGGSVVAAADDHESRVRMMGEHDGQGVQQDEQSLALEVPANEEDRRWRGNRTLVGDQGDQADHQTKS